MLALAAQAEGVVTAFDAASTRFAVLFDEAAVSTGAGGGGGGGLNKQTVFKRTECLLR